MDLVPVDFVSNLIIVGSVETAMAPAGTISVKHATTSSTNGITFKTLTSLTTDYMQHNPSYRQIREPHITHVDNAYRYQALLYLNQTLPLELLHCYTKLPIVGSSGARKNAKKQIMLAQKFNETTTVYFHFLNNTWNYNFNGGDRLLAKMSAEELADFPFDPRIMDWKTEVRGFIYGLRRFYNHEDCLSPENPFKQILAKN